MAPSSPIQLRITMSASGGHGKHILAAGKAKKISKWAVPEHAWPDSKNAPEYQTTLQAQHRDTEAEDCDTE
ncbi:hypothetical protein AZE42_01069, partial [Rhizopogon vesiculosus]